MARGRPRREVIEEKGDTGTETPPQPTEKEHLLALYQELKDRNIRSLSDLEGQIARAE